MINPQVQRQDALVKRREDLIKAAYFRQTADGLIYRAPNPWIFGRADHFQVTEAHQIEIVAAFVPKVQTREWRISQVLGFGVIALSILAMIASLLNLYGLRYPAAETASSFAAAALLIVMAATLTGLHYAAKRQRQKLQPILATATPARERISNADVLWAMRTSGGRPAIRRQGLISGVIYGVASAAIAGYALISSKDRIGFVDNLQPEYCLALALGFAIQAGRNLYQARTGMIAANTRTTDQRFKVMFAVLTFGYVALAFGYLGLELSGVIKRDDAATHARFERRAAAGDGAAMSALGGLYREGRGVPLDYAKARDWFEKAAAQSDEHAMFWLGWLAQKGLAGPQDYVAARQWYEKSALIGNGSAMTWTGWLYLYGQGVPKDFIKAREWFEKAAAANNVAGMHNLGSIYRHGWGVAQDYTQARSWYLKAAAGSFAASMNELGMMDMNGWGTAPDVAKARTWFEKAAAAGNLDAMQHVAILLDRGDGGSMDTKRAAHLVLQSAKLGHSWSQNALGSPGIVLSPGTRLDIKRELSGLALYDGPIDERWDDKIRAAVDTYLKKPG